MSTTPDVSGTAGVGTTAPRAGRATGWPTLEASEAAAMIPDGAKVAFSGFTAAGGAKAVPLALAARARGLHDAGQPFSISVLTGASTGEQLDEALAQARAIRWRAPYASSRTLRQQINTQQVEFIDMHLSHVPQMLEYGFLGELDFAVVEATDVTPDGRIYLTASVGCTPSCLRHARRIIVERNAHHSPRMWEMHDIAFLPPPPQRSPIPVHHPLSRIGVPFVQVDPARIVGVVETDEADGVPAFKDSDDTAAAIARHVAAFLVAEVRAGRIPPGFCPLQAGVGNVSNAVMSALVEDADIPDFLMFTEVLQDAQIDAMRRGRLLGASTSALTLTDPVMGGLVDDMDFFARRIVLRPQELSNNPGLIRRLGVIGINTILEMDIYGMANSTHVAGTQLMNGIGGSGDFTRNSYLSILMAPSTAKAGHISAVVPMVSHCDHNEHSVQVLVTEHGLADLRGKGPAERAALIIDTCAHPEYRPYLHRYLESCPPGHFRHRLDTCFDLHRSLAEAGSMRPAAGLGA